MRGLKIKKRPVQIDYLYKSKIVGRFVNAIMIHGKKSLAEKAIYCAIASLSEDKKQALTMFEQAIRNVMPKQEVRSRRIGGATYQIPMPLRHERAEALAIRWIVSAARGRKGKPISEKLALEFKDAFAGTGPAVKKRDDVHRMADANKAFSHFKF